MTILPSGTHEMANHITRMEITGSLAAPDGKPVELDMFVYDDEGKCYSMSVMTVERYDTLRGDMLDGREEEGTAHIFVLNEERIVLDSLTELLRAPDVKVFDPYLQPVADTAA